MAPPRPKPISIVLGALAGTFVIIMIILCSTISTPSSKPAKQGPPLTTSTVPPSTKEQATTIAVPPSTKEQATTTAVPPSTKEQTTTTAVPSFTKEQTTTTAVPSSTKEQTTTTAVPPSTEEQTTREHEENICKTQSCKKLALRMLSTMDHGGVSPCEDFYQYSCGGVMDELFILPEDSKLVTENHIKENLLMVEHSDSLLGPMRMYYDICLNYTRANNETVRRDHFQQVFHSLGFRYNPNIKGVASVPLTGYNEVDLTETLAKMMKKHFTPFFDLLLDVDDTNKTMFALKLTPPLFQSSFTDDYAKAVCQHKYNQLKQETKLPNEQFNINNAYRNFTECMTSGEGLGKRMHMMEELTKKLGLMDHMNNVTLQDTILDATTTTTNFLLTDISELLPDVPTLRTKSLKKKYETVTLKQLFNGTVFKSSVIDWKTLITTMLNQEVNEDMFKVHVYFKKELGSILNLIGNYQKDEPLMLQNMLLMLWSERLYMDLVNPVNDYISTPSYCYRATVNLMEDSASYLYLSTLNDESSKSKLIKTMIDNSKKAATVMLDRQDPNTASNLLDKLKQLEGKVADLGVKQSLEAKLKKQIEEGNLNINGNFVNISMKLLERYRTLLYDNTFLAPSSNDVMWSQFLLPKSTSGVVVYALNKFLIPLGAMEVPLYNPDVPHYLNYAGIGHMVAHELMHTFDATGLLYNETAKHAMTIPPDIVPMIECLAGLLDKPFYHHSGTNVNSNFTLNKDLKLNEVLADSGAARLAWEAYLLQIAPTTPPPVNEISSRSNTARRKRSLFGEQQPSSSSYPMPSVSTSEQRLPWLDMEPIQLYFLRIAQNQCSRVSELDLSTVMESSHLPASLRVNYILKNEPLFAKAFNCEKNSTMNPTRQCPYLLG